MYCRIIDHIEMVYSSCVCLFTTPAFTLYANKFKYLFKLNLHYFVIYLLISIIAFRN